MTGTLERALKILEHLSSFPEGASLAALAAGLELPASACHRLLTELIRCGFVRQDREFGDYALTTKIAAIGLSHLTNTGIVDMAQPIIDQVAQESGELVRLSIIDGERLTFVAKAQGARAGLRYDPDMGLDVMLSCSAAGHAWLMTLPDDQVLDILQRHGLGSPEKFGPKAPTSIRAVRKYIAEARERGFSMISEVFAPAMSSVGAPIQRKGQPAIGVLTIAGPLVRFTEKRMLSIGPLLINAAADLALASAGSPMFAKRAKKAA
ncbi:MAG TPA: IclR family transcriptional regulator [Burkholderiales bacterium]|jgi:DNA-binding IclR family transcriptional regulator|nr:IclR family transcriptional regulator [Burkholderiales bacterium]